MGEGEDPSTCVWDRRGGWEGEGEGRDLEGLWMGTESIVAEKGVSSYGFPMTAWSGTYVWNGLPVECSPSCTT